jgi:hypothetical protein
MDSENTQKTNSSTVQETDNSNKDQNHGSIAYDPEESIPFLYINVRRLIVMSVLSFNLYSFYWFYKNWQAIEYGKKRQISPFFRAVFSIFYCYSLFKEIAYMAKQANYKRVVHYKRLSVIYIILRLLPSAFAIFPLFLIPLLPLQRAINFYCQQNNFEKEINYH